MIKRAALFFKFSTYSFPKIQKLEPETDISKMKKITLIHPSNIASIKDITDAEIL